MIADRHAEEPTGKGLSPLFFAGKGCVSGTQEALWDIPKAGLKPRATALGGLLTGELTGLLAAVVT